MAAILRYKNPRALLFRPSLVRDEGVRRRRNRRRKQAAHPATKIEQQHSIFKGESHQCGREPYQA